MVGVRFSMKYLRSSIWCEEDNDPVIQEIFREHLKPHEHTLPETYRKGLERACQEKFAFLVVHTIAYPLWDQLPCTLVELPDVHFPPILGSFIIGKHSHYHDLFSYGLIELRQNGVKSLLKHKTWDHAVEPEEVVLQPIQVSSIASILTILAMSISLSLLVMAVQRRCHV